MANPAFHPTHCGFAEWAGELFGRQKITDIKILPKVVESQIALERFYR